MVDYHFINAEEELLHVIRLNGSTYEEYQRVIETVQNINYTDANDRSFLHEAICQNKPEIAMDLMRRGIDVDLETVGGHTAAHLAVSGGHWALFRELLQYHPNVNRRERRHGNTLLHDVVFYTSEERNQAAQELLKLGANPFAKNDKGFSPLDFAVRNENQELVEAFQNIAVPQQPEEAPRFRVPMRARGFYVVKIREYQKYILVEHAALQYLEDKILDYATICGGKKVSYQFQLTPIQDCPWTVIRCPDNMDFYNYHNLMSWIWGLPEDQNPPSQTICVAQHKNDERLSYYGIMDKQKFKDTRLVGRFQNGESFSIYLPEAYKKDGNAQCFGDVLPIQSIVQYLASCGFDAAWLNTLSELPGKELIVEMAV